MGSVCWLFYFGLDFVSLRISISRYMAFGDRCPRFTRLLWTRRGEVSNQMGVYPWACQGKLQGYRELSNHTESGKWGIIKSFSRGPISINDDNTRQHKNIDNELTDSRSQVWATSSWALQAWLWFSSLSQSPQSSFHEDSGPPNIMFGSETCYIMLLHIQLHKVYADLGWSLNDRTQRRRWLLKPKYHAAWPGGNGLFWNLWLITSHYSLLPQIYSTIWGCPAP